MSTRIPRKENSYEKVNFLKPINADKVMAHDTEVNGNSCFGKEWSPDDNFCSICHDLEMCGLVFHANQRKTVTVWESNNVPTLDKHNLDCIDIPGLIEWVKKSPRSFKDFVDRVFDQANVADKTTVVYWCKSFILDNTDKLSISKGVVSYVG